MSRPRTTVPPILTLAALLLVPLLVAGVLVYTLLNARFRATPPGPATDPALFLNARHSEPSEPAAPAYSALHARWEALRPAEAAQPDFNLADVTPAHALYPDVVAALHTMGPELSGARQAASLPELGATFEPPAPETKDPNAAPPADPWLIDYTIPQLAPTMTAARLLRIDASDAATSSDPERLAADLHATLGIARQFRTCPAMIADIVAARIVDSSCDVLLHALSDHPALLNADQLAALQSDLADTAEHLTMRLDLERQNIVDVLDRTFSPGDSGRITAEGIRRLAQKPYMNTMFQASIPDLKALDAPIRARAMATRAEHLAWFDKLLDGAGDARDHGPAAIQEYLNTESELVYAPSIETRMPVALMLTPAFGSALVTEQRARLAADATRTALALSRYHAAHAAYPDGLEALAPDLLAAIPADPYDLAGGHIKYATTATAFTLYYNAADLDDDHATRPPASTQPYELTNFAGLLSGQPAYNAPDADWVLFPPDP